MFFDDILDSIGSLGHSAFEAVEDAFETVGSGISNVASSVFTEVKQDVGSAVDIIGNVAERAEQDVGVVLSHIEKDALTVVDNAKEIIENTEDRVGNVASQTLTTVQSPLLLIGAGVLAFLFFSGQQSGFTGTFNR
jgi:hypothetical protein